MVVSLPFWERGHFHRNMTARRRLSKYDGVLRQIPRPPTNLSKTHHMPCRRTAMGATWLPTRAHHCTRNQNEERERQQPQCKNHRKEQKLDSAPCKSSEKSTSIKISRHSAQNDEKSNTNWRATHFETKPVLPMEHPSARESRGGNCLKTRIPQREMWKTLRSKKAPPKSHVLLRIVLDWQPQTRDTCTYGST